MGISVKNNISGLLLCSVLAVLALAVSSVTPVPVMLLAIIIGLFAHMVYRFEPFIAGIDWCARGLLYIGVALMGLRIDLADLSQAGFLAPILVIVTLMVTLFFGFFLARKFGQTKDFSILMSGAVAICGVSAAAAICAALDDCDSRNQEVAITVAGVTVLSTLTMILYPLIAHTLDLNALASGLLMGGSIHNVSQAIGAGYSMSPEAGDLSVLLKLIRVSMLLPIVILVSLIWGKNPETPYPNMGAKIRANTPLFLVVFLILAALNCLHFVPKFAVDLGNQLAHGSLIIALIAIGIKTNMKEVLTVGIKPLMAMTLTTGFMAIFVLIGTYCIGAL